MSRDALRFTAEIERRERLAACTRGRGALWNLAQICLVPPFVPSNDLSESFHLPLMREMDRKDDLRLRTRYNRYEGHMWPRYFFKTTLVKLRVIKRLLRDPLTSFVWWHAVEEHAQEEVRWIGRQFMENDELRALRPDMMPSKRLKKWASASGFRFKPSIPTMRAFGSGSEATGSHALVGVLDDIIGLNTIEDSGMPKIIRWFGNTVMHVIKKPPELWMQGTHWDLNDIYGGWRKHPNWDIEVRGCYETDGVPDWNGEPSFLPREEIERIRKDMSRYEFSCQMMNDPLPDEDRMWDASSEQFCTLKEASGPGRIFILSDPAPASMGSIDGTSEKFRGDGSKDEWTIAAVKIRVRNKVQEGIVLEVIGSRDWTKSAGLDQCVRLMSKWGTNLLFVETYGRDKLYDYSIEAAAAARRAGQSLYLEKDQLLPPLTSSYTAGAKNQGFESLCDWNKAGRLYWCESIHKDDLDKTLEQCRNWRVTGKRNTLRYDDRADVCRRLTDASLQQFAPRASELGDVWALQEDEEQEAILQRSRYCGI